MRPSSLLPALLFVAGCAAPLAQTPPAGVPAQVPPPDIREGDSWNYSLHDGYTRLPQGTLEYRVTSVQADTVTVRLLHEGRESSEIYTRDWNWRERPMTNLQNFRYEPAYIALPFPLEAGKSWRAYVKAADPLSGETSRVRIDGRVLGWERVRVPAGEFDALMVRRLVYAGNEDTFRSQEYITEIDWYAPRLGQVVRHESRSGYLDKRIGCDHMNNCGWIDSGWDVVELLAHQPAGAARGR